MASESRGIASIAERYAAALFELADESKAVDAVAADFRAIEGMLKESTDLRAALRSPLVARDDKVNAVHALGEAVNFAPMTRNFLGVLGANGRLFVLPQIVSAFLKELACRRGEVSAEVVTARPLSEAQAAALSAVLNEAVGSSVSLNMKQKPDLLGGMVVKVGSRLVDTSIKAKLDRLELAMREAR